MQDREQELVVGADDGLHAVPIIRFYGIPAEDLHSLAEGIRKIPAESLMGPGNPSDKILVTHVPLNHEVGEIRKMILCRPFDEKLNRRANEMAVDEAQAAPYSGVLVQFWYSDDRKAKERILEWAEML